MYPPNPYAQAPLYRENVYVPPGSGSSGQVPTKAIRVSKLVLGILQLCGLLFGIAMIVIAFSVQRSLQDTFVAIGASFLGLWYLALIPYGILNMVWIYKMWNWIPPEQRHTKLWKKYISPGQAVGFLFIPYFNIYWMFVMYLGICDVFERLQVAYPTSRPSPRNLALATLIVPMVCFPAGPFFHFFFDKHIEGMAAETQARMVRL